MSVLLIILLQGTVLASSSTLPEELVRASPETAALIENNAENGFGLAKGIAALWADAKKAATTYLTAGIRSIAFLMAGIILLGMVESLLPENNSLIHQCATMTGALWITAVSAGSLHSLIGLGRETVTNLSVLAKSLLPALSAATAVMGGVTAASARQVITVFFSNLLLSVMENLLLPILYLYIGVSAAGAVMEGSMLASLGNLLKKIITWTLIALLTGFTTYLTISGALAGSADAQAVKLAKSAVSTAVPVVGGILSDAAEGLLAGAGLLRAMIGTFGTLAILGFSLSPFLRLGIQYILYQGAGLVAEAAGPERLTGLLKSLGDAFGLVLAMTGTAAALLLISLIASLKAVTL